MAEIVDFGLQQHKIKMDSRYFENVLSVVAGDTGRRIEVQLLDTNGMVQDTTGLNLRLNAEIAGKATFTDATLVDATTGKYQLDLSNGMFLAPGNWQFQWQITDSVGKKLHSFAFTGNIGKNISEGGSQATNFYLNLEDLKKMQDDLINGTIDSSILETTITEKLTDLETQYAPKLTEVTAQLVQTEIKKADKNHVWSMANMGQDVKESMTGGSVAVLGDGMVLEKNIVDSQVTPVKTTFFKQSEKNLWDGKWYIGRLSGANPYDLIGGTGRHAVIPIQPNTDYTITRTTEADYMAVAFFTEFPKVGSVPNLVRTGITGTEKYTITSDSSSNYMLVQSGTSTQGTIIPSVFQVEKGKVQTPYESPLVLSNEFISSEVSLSTSLDRTSIGDYSILICSGKPINFNLKTKVLEFPTIQESNYISLSVGYYRKLWSSKIDDLDLTGGGSITNVGALYFDLKTESFYVSTLNNSTVLDTQKTENSLLVAVYYLLDKKVVMTGTYTVDSVDSGVDDTQDDGIRYVSPTGSDTNNGLTSETAFKTFQHAINSGGKKVFAKPGDYIGQTLSASGMESLEIKTIPSTYVKGDLRKPPVRFFNSEDVSLTFDETSGLYTTQLSVANTSNFHKVFIDKTLAIEKTGLQSTSYNAILWEINAEGIENDKKLVPVLSLPENQSIEGSFFYDGATLYVNPTGNDVTGKTFKKLINENGSIIEFTGIHKLIMEDVDVQFPAAEGIYTIDCNDTTLTHCEAGYSAYSTGIRARKTNAKHYSCNSYKHNADGFAPSMYGDVHYYNCNGFYNYDDGVSHHDNCTGSVQGGNWSHNGKAGIAPAYGAKVNWSNCFIGNNKYGAYQDSYDYVTNISSGNIYIENETAILNNAVLKSVGDKFVNNTKDFMWPDSVDVY